MVAFDLRSFCFLLNTGSKGVIAYVTVRIRSDIWVFELEEFSYFIHKHIAAYMPFAISIHGNNDVIQAMIRFSNQEITHTTTNLVFEIDFEKLGTKEQNRSQVFEHHFPRELSRGRKERANMKASPSGPRFKVVTRC